MPLCSVIAASTGTVIACDRYQRAKASGDLCRADSESRCFQ